MKPIWAKKQRQKKGDKKKLKKGKCNRTLSQKKKAKRGE
jgi:hypothetical protein